jgi:hypothetical protein
MSIKITYPNRLTMMSLLTAPVIEGGGYEVSAKAPGIIGWCFEFAKKRGWLKKVQMKRIENIFVDNLQSQELHEAIFMAIADVTSLSQIDQYFIAMGQTEFFQLKYQFNYHAGPFSLADKNEFCGVEVRCVPWMKGWALIPK